MTIKERIYRFINESDISVRQFEKNVGLSNGAVSKMGNSTRRSVLDKIFFAYPNISQIWLLTGEGEMLKNDSDFKHELRSDSNVHKDVMVPLIHIDSVGGMRSQNLLTSGEQYVERMVPFPNARPDDVAILQSGNSMAPTIPAGAILQIRRVEKWRDYFGYGSDFVLWLDDDRRITKQVLKCTADPRNYVVCHSYNPEVADEELPKAMIREVWKVVNVLINKGW